jgi:hypothetical protein
MISWKGTVRTGTGAMPGTEGSTHLIASRKFASMNSLSLFRFTDTVCGRRIGERGLERNR